jgi:hypothetical protein
MRDWVVSWRIYFFKKKLEKYEFNQSERREEEAIVISLIWESELCICDSFLENSPDSS